MKNIFKNSLIKIWLKKNSKNLIQVETKYGKLYLLKNDKFITNSFLNGKYWAEYEIKIFEDLLNTKFVCSSTGNKNLSKFAFLLER